MSADRVTKSVLAALLVLATGMLHARGTYQEPQDFIAKAFAGDPPEPRVLWITKDLRGPTREILGHDLGALRVRYWGRGGRTAWILEEIGKEKPITIGIVIEQGRIKSLRVLVFRESRGWEVRHAFFTDQFTEAQLTAAHQLDRPIDGISGATLSVSALTRVARLALFLHQQTDMADVAQP